jgi:hypothetical protein
MPLFWVTAIGLGAVRWFTDDAEKHETPAALANNDSSISEKQP